eukprot:453709-Pelagomonas_calceolata.AAC.4
MQHCTADSEAHKAGAHRAACDFCGRSLAKSLQLPCQQMHMDSTPYGAQQRQLRQPHEGTLTPDRSCQGM